jgi:hypothetical protein
MERMSNWLAITWETDRLLFLSASVHGKLISFDFATSIDDPKKITELVNKHRLAKAETIVILNRSDVEVRSMVFPPVPLAELPDLVKFQAGKEFNHYDPAAPLDFFVTNKLENVSRSTLFPVVQAAESTPGGAPKHLLASTLRLAAFQKIKTFCKEQNLTLRHIVLRPCATALLWRQSGNADPNQSVLLVELDKYETSQIVVFQGEPVFMRSPKIHCPQDVSNSDFAARLLAELKRTRIAVRNEIQGINVDEVILCGSGASFTSLAEQLTAGLEMPVNLFDPKKGLNIKTDAVNEQFAALFGAVLQAAKKEPMQIDFCHPKKRKEDTGKRNLLTGIAAAVLILVIGLFGYVFYSRMVLNNNIKELTRQFNELKMTAGTVVEQRKQLDAIDVWLADNVNWFEQLDWLSRCALPSQDMRIKDLEFSSANGGTIRFTSHLRDMSVLLSMEEHFRDEHHFLQTLTRNEVNDNSRYHFRCNLSISLDKKSGR